MAKALTKYMSFSSVMDTQQPNNATIFRKKQSLPFDNFVGMPLGVEFGYNFSTIGEKWFKSLDLDVQNYKPFIKGHYKDAIKKVFTFG